jgi:AraC family transcriptional regulator, transcriptional activator of pobA
MQPLPPHRKTFHDFFFLTDGELRRSKGIESYTLTAGTFCFIPAYQITSGAFGSTNMCGYMCHFNEELFSLGHHPFLSDLPFFKFNGRPIVQVPTAYIPVVSALLERIGAEFIGNLPNRDVLIQSYLITLFLELSRFVETANIQKSNAALRITDQFKNLLNAKMGQRHLITEYAAELAVSPNHLNKCVKQATNRSAGEWINEMVLLESKVLLAQSSLTIAEVAYKIGMEDQSYFGRFFKNKTGFTPTHYRKLIKKSENRLELS